MKQVLNRNEERFKCWVCHKHFEWMDEHRDCGLFISRMYDKLDAGKMTLEEVEDTPLVCSSCDSVRDEVDEFTRPEKVERSLDCYNLAFGSKEKIPHGEGTPFDRKWSYRIYVLGENEYISSESSKEWGWKYGWYGPGVVTLNVPGDGGMIWSERDVNDPGHWAWISRLMRDGFECPDEVEVFSPDERDVSRRNEAVAN